MKIFLGADHAGFDGDGNEPSGSIKTIRIQFP